MAMRLCPLLGTLDGALVGLADAPGDAEAISEAVKTQMDPAPEIDLSIHEEDGRRFVVVEVRAGAETPYYTLVKGHRDAYVRIGNESVKADAIQLKRLVLKGSGRSWDSLSTRYVRTNYSFEMLRAAYFAKTKTPFAEEDFESFGLADDDGNYGISINGIKIPAATGDKQEILPENPLKTLLKSPLKKTDRILVDIIAKTPTATISMMQKKAGITRDGVNKALKRLKTSGIVRRVGPDKGGHWEVVAAPQPPLK